MKRSRMLVVSALAVSVSICAMMEGKSRFANEPRLRGTAYMPEQPFLLKMTDEDKKARDSGLSEWQIIEEQMPATAIRLVFFRGKNGADRIDLNTQDKATIECVCAGLTPSLLRRWALSDFSESREGFFGVEDGVIVITFGKRNLVIGIMGEGFVFGKSKGNTHQLCESWMLAKAVDAMLVRETGEGLGAEHFARLSGEATIEWQKQEYARLTGQLSDK